ncbi:ABC transporter substrate-binding protein [Paenibacillus segetis]|uniref:ABC transporter substrate-binding protein n=1 Tax=Paenibacillus segetis TaxID=1325360 RepID=A0ABQ1YRR6_9BACL|nr:ABC transporter substrate-binding protein [Paenibacillus segetis]GGH35142.1 ABC transporter substrate-binding protein [Paenibacillus segetis]
MKIRKKKFIGMLAAITVLSGLLGACSSNGNNNSSGENQGNNNVANTGGEETYHAVMAIPSFQSEPKDMQLVEDEINKLLKDKVNATVDILPIAFGNWTQQTNLMLSSGEKLDLLVSGLGTYASQAVSGKFAPLDDLLTGPGKGIADSVGETYINAGKVNGHIYGVTSLHDLASSFAYVMRKDLVDKYHIDTASIKTLDDVEKVLQTIKDNEPGITPLVPSGAGNNGIGLVEYLQHDTLGDAAAVFGALMDPNDLTVSNFYDSKDYKELVTKTHDWYNKGLILRDAATNQVAPGQLVRANKAFSYFGSSKPGYQISESRGTDTEMVVVEMGTPLATTGHATSLMWSIAQNSENKEKAMEILNLFYTDKDLINLINWGIEGKHYQKVEDNVIDFAPGVDVTNSSYFPGWEWMTGNEFLGYVFKGNDPEIWTQTKEFNDNATKSKAMGFTFNPEPVKNEYTALTNVANQLRIGLESGVLDPEEVLPEFNEKLKAAGIDKVIAEKQKQLDEWAQQNNVK